MFDGRELNQWKWMKILIFSEYDFQFFIACFSPSRIAFFILFSCNLWMWPMENCVQFILYFVIAINPWNDTIDYRYVQLKLANTFTTVFIFCFWFYLVWLSHLTMYPMIAGHIPNWKQKQKNKNEKYKNKTITQNY